MKKRRVLTEDPVVEEVRAIRADLWRQAGGTVTGLMRLLDQGQRPKRRAAAGRSKRSTRSIVRVRSRDK